MAVRFVCPVVVGRDAELTLLDEAFARATGGESSIVLIGGEAGIGKTRLAEEAAGRAEALGARVLTGRCVPLGGEGLPFAPLVDALRTLARATPTGELEALLGRARPELARLLPELDPDGTAAPPTVDGGTSRLFELILGVVGRLAADRPLVLVVEDLHWADQSTIDLVAFMSSALRSGRVLLVATYRSDELQRRHPLHTVLAELERLRTATVIPLERFGRAQVAEQLGGILGSRPDPELTDVVFNRSEGNAFLVEEVLGAVQSGDPNALSPSLRHLLLARAARLAEPVQELLRVIAMAGRPVPHGLLAAVTGLPPGELSALLREAVEDHLLVVDAAGHGYTFRHSLLRDAVYEDTLPGDRVSLHSAYAGALGDDPRLAGGGAAAASELAYHLYAGFDLERALPAAMEAARANAAASAFAEAGRHLERVLEIWPRVPGAEDHVGVDHLGVMEMAVDMAFQAGELDRAVRIVDAALGNVDRGADPERAALLLVRRARILRQLRGSAGLYGQLEAALALLPADPPTHTLAVVLDMLAAVLIPGGELGRASEVAERAVAVARAVGAKPQEASALVSLGGGLVYTGDVDGGIEILRRAVELATEIESYETALRGHLNLSDALENVGRHQAAIDVASAGVGLARRVGRERSWGLSLICNQIEPLIRLGRWDEADRLIVESAPLNPSGVDLVFLHTLATELATARGRLTEAAEHLRTIRSVPTELDPQYLIPLSTARAELARRRQDWDAAMGAIDQGLTAGELITLRRYSWRLIWTGLRVVAEAAESGRHNPELTARLRALADEMPTDLEWLRPFQLLALGEHGRIVGDASAEPWATAAAVIGTDGDPYLRSYALLRLAEAELVAGNRPAAVDAVTESAELAERLNAGPMLDQALDLIKRARLGRDTIGTDPLEAMGITSREAEVLRLVAGGRSNGQIGEELYISPKTASVHVSNILTKLGVSTRGEAAAAAYRLGLVDGASGPPPGPSKLA